MAEIHTLETFVCDPPERDGEECRFGAWKVVHVHTCDRPDGHEGTCECKCGARA